MGTGDVTIMEKQVLLKRLDEALKHEESATAVYLEHLRAVVDRLTNNKDFLKEVKTVFNYLIEANKGHQKKCQTLIDQISKEDSNDI